MTVHTELYISDFSLIGELIGTTLILKTLFVSSKNVIGLILCSVKSLPLYSPLLLLLLLLLQHTFCTVRFYRILLKKEKVSQINTKLNSWPPSVAT